MQQFVQIALLVVALAIGIFLIRSQSTPAPPNSGDSATTESIDSGAMKMLGYIEGQIADQEDVKDVRC